jgi:S1/P1 Nuclease
VSYFGHLLLKDDTCVTFRLHFLASLALCSNASAWGDTGHKIVCEIAFRLAQPDTRATIRKLIRSDSEFDTFSDSCVYPDHPRKRPSEHFINLPRDSNGLKTDDCPQGEKCVLSAIRNDSEVLSSKHESERLAHGQTAVTADTALRLGRALGYYGRVLDGNAGTA